MIAMTVMIVMAAVILISARFITGRAAISGMTAILTDVMQGAAALCRLRWRWIFDRER